IMRSCRLSTALGMLAVALGSCAPPATVVRTTSPSGGDAFVIGCEESPRYCKEKANEVCPFGSSTLEPGVGGFYDEGEDYRKGQATPGTKHLYKLENWVIRCNQPMIGGSRRAAR